MITQRQKDCLELIAKAKVCPSYDEMAEALGIGSKSGISRIVNGLEERGMINRMPNYARAIEVTAKGKALLSGVQMEPDFEAYVDGLMDEIWSALLILKLAIEYNDPKEKLVFRIEDIESIIKTKWREK